MQRAAGWLGWAAMLAVLALSVVYESTPLSGEVLCVFRRLTGTSCPGCGLTRSFVAMARLDLAAAFGFHLAGPWLWVTAAAAVLLRPAQAALGWRSVWAVAPRLMQGWVVLFGVLFVIHTGRWLVGIAQMLP